MSEERLGGAVPVQGITPAPDSAVPPGTSIGAGGTDRDRWMAFLAGFGITPHRGMESDVLYWRSRETGDVVVKLEFDEAERFTGVSVVE